MELASKQLLERVHAICGDIRLSPLGSDRTGGEGTERGAFQGGFASASIIITPIAVQLKNPSKIPARLIGIVLGLFVIAAEALVVERAYPVESLRIHLATPKAPLLQARKEPPLLHESGFMQFDKITPNASIIEAGKPLSFDVPVVMREFNSRAAVRRKRYLSGLLLGTELGRGSGTWVTLGTLLTNEQANGLLDGSLTQYVFWWSMWDDSMVSNPSTEGCFWLQTPQGRDLAKEIKLMWHHCE